MKKTIVLTMLLLSVVGALAQENDTALLRQLKVSEVKKYQVIHTFTRKGDTCLADHYKLNAHGLETFSMKDFSCSGYTRKDEQYTTYRGRQKATQWYLQNGDTLAAYYYEYNGKSELPKVKEVVLLSTGDTTRTDYTYYPRKKTDLLDSTRIFVSNREGIRTFVNKNQYDKKNNLLVSVTEDSKGTPLAETTNKWDANGTRSSIINASFGEKVVFEQTFFKYDEAGRVIETTDTHNRQNLYTYTEDGLLNSMVSYNAKGEFELEFLYRYQFAE